MTRELYAQARLAEDVRVVVHHPRWHVDQDPAYARWPADRPGLHALRLRVENHGRSLVAEPVARTAIVTSGGRLVEADALADLDALAAGEAVEAWLVFFLREGETPALVRITDRRGAEHDWPLGDAPTA